MRPVTLATLIAFALTAPASAAGPVQNAQPNPVSPQRVALYDNIRGSLPNIGARWSVYCTPNSARMRCWARNPQARYVRRYLAAIQHGGFSLVAVAPWRLGNTKHGVRFDGIRG